MPEDKLLDFSNFNTSKIPIKSKNTKRSLKNLSVLGNAKPGEVTSKDIIQSLFQRFHNHRYMINNAVIFEWESDFFTVTESDYLYEIEIKVSRSDFKDDFNKVNKHALLEGKEGEKSHLMPNKFFYAAPKGLLNTWDVPEYAGLIEVERGTEAANILKDAPFLHRDKIWDQYKDILLDKFSWRYKQNLLNNYQNALNDLEDSE